ncbi:GCN5 family N-acetyltransferase [Glutamicibacter uratoxydans]|uniref:GCN5 family N-acetyltransferase n=1 Tax=Glutamicibacter uratoxydans TaxID=43667 RepID=A0A4Y4DPQ2_GLUUR|nr:GNAT family protein [Glutamicibacter uratoxydans]GED06896.1 GCN5 family N-acetyltransferase [Glutamicibacter uratoxydans]
MPEFEPLSLRGKLVTLEPLSIEHHDGLVEAASDGELWNLWYTSVPRPEAMAAEIQKRLKLQAEGSMLPFTTRLNDPQTGEPGKIIGMTTYCDIDLSVPKVEIGYTWNAASAHGTGTNAESKRLLLTHAFEQMNCEAVVFCTHWMNQQSRAAISRLGAKQDGVLRAHTRMADGSLRDTVVFSILVAEWPQVRNELDRRLNRY